MYIGMVFLAYMFSLFIAITSIMLVILLIRKQEFRPTEMFVNIRMFSLSIMMLCAFYLFMYFRERFFDDIEVEPLMRFIEYFLYAAVEYLWLRILVFMAEGRILYRRMSYIIGGLLLADGIFVTMCMDNSYYIENTAIRSFEIFFEFGITVVTIIFICFMLDSILRNEMIKHRKRFAITVSVLILIWNVDQCIVDFGLYAGSYEYSIWTMEDPTAILMLLIALFVLIYLFKEDFSPLFFSENKSDETIIEKIAESHRLTVRECEVLRLIYSGYTNAEIADELVISINTVKKHTQNMYEKLAIGNRMELIQLIMEKTEKNG
ncbi:MAG: helix-turn-helix transcriptional regulator [Clostridiales bacterium]|nr:helix-turn-helix transcriptional regulator [Clostridiales bacterium]MDD6389532.1 helix-turn-helix transcriptional regulator [Bacillota bacterium]